MKRKVNQLGAPKSAIASRLASPTVKVRDGSLRRQILSFSGYQNETARYPKRTARFCSVSFWLNNTLRHVIDSTTRK